MKRFSAIAAGLLIWGLAGCAHMSVGGGAWVTIFDGSSLAGWERTGDANWRLADGSVVADKGSGFLVTQADYADFELKAEFWIDAEGNSGIFIRCEDRQKPNATVCYEVNIFDQRPVPEYGTGAIVDVAKVSPMPKAGGKWNTYEITAKGNHLTVVLNGVRTVDVQDGRHARGAIGLQYAPGVVKDAGVIKFRKVQVRAL
jgi:Domain of Unknown Function (DUF1080)